MSSTAQGSTSSFPLFGILGIVFIVLKLTEVIAWSWWWVLAPFWGPIALLFAIAAIGGIGFGLFALIKALSKKTTTAVDGSLASPTFNRYTSN